ncbi:MAG: alpha/beta hydrolase [Oscillospiraceae bacterium]|nr:alpha/beta hydrolase [Oscillospiraceae bacterium]
MNRKSKIVYPDNPNGIYHYETPMIGGIRQYIQIRGTDKRNPLLLFLHGGPGGSLAGFCHILQTGWEEHFTVVHWDQRNACKTYLANKARAKEIAKTGTMDDFVQDIHEVIAYLHTVLDFDKLILMGFSWGSAIGAEYAKRHPENLLCYIGIGQLVNYRDGVFCTCEKLLRLMPQGSADAAKIEKLMADFPEHPVWNKELTQCMRHFMPLSAKYIMKHVKRVPLGKILKSPFLNLKEKYASLVGNPAMQKQAFVTMLAYDFREDLNFGVPLLFVFGEEESVCPSELVQACFDEISAPRKQIAVIPQAGHSCFFDQPEVFMKTLLEFLG